MKKFLSVLLAFVLAVTIMAPSYVFAAAGNEAAKPNACSHSSYTESYYTTYTPLDNEYHEVYRTPRRRCNICGDVFWVGNPIPLPLEKHSGDTHYVRSDHEGPYWEHRYVHGGTCEICDGYYEIRLKTRCTKVACVEVYSINEHETQ